MARQHVKCNGPTCGRMIVFLDTAAGRKIPVDVDDKLSPLDTEYVHGRHTPHHSTCPDAASFKRKRRHPTARGRR